MDLRSEKLRGKDDRKSLKRKKKAYVAYPVELLTIEQKDGISRKYASNILHEIKSDIYGCCI